MGYTDNFFGASLSFWLEGIPRATARAVEFMLTPTGPLLDGSTASVIVGEAILKYPSSDDGLRDLPVGTYRLKAVLIDKDGSRTSLGIATAGSSEYEREIDLVCRRPVA